MGLAGEDDLAVFMFDLEIGSPLMLTAICFLYNDDKVLPGQRAELYDRFVTNLLYKRFGGEASKIRNVLTALASKCTRSAKKTSPALNRCASWGENTRKSGEETDREYIVRKILLENEDKPFPRRLAVHSLIDIQSGYDHKLRPNREPRSESQIILDSLIKLG